MEKIIKIGKERVRLCNNVAWTLEYKDQFGHDILPAIMPVLASAIEAAAAVIQEADGEDGKVTLEGILGALEGRTLDVLLPVMQVEFVDAVVNVTWAMAKAADENIEPPKQWVRQFDTFPLDTVFPAIFEMVIKGFVSSKNLQRLKQMKSKVRDLQPSQSPSMTSSSQEQSEG